MFNVRFLVFPPCSSRRPPSMGKLSDLKAKLGIVEANP